MVESRIQRHIDSLLERYPHFQCCKEDILKAYKIVVEAYEKDCKLLIAGNGGSAADAEHIAGELMKSFKLSRSVPESFVQKLKSVDPERGLYLSHNLEQGLLAIPLVAHEALTTAYINDVDGQGVFAQQLFCFGRRGDVFLGLSTSGNSRNVIDAAIVAKALGMKTISLTGAQGGELASISDVSINVPASETYIVQEMHLPVYHCLCLMLEERFFGSD